MSSFFTLQKQSQMLYFFRMVDIKKNYYSFAVSDFDGTLLKSDGTVDGQTIKIIDDFKKRGGIFAICTGRMSTSIIPLCKQMGLRGYVITFNGAEICDIESGKKVFSSHVSNNACIKLLEYAEKNGYKIQVYPNDILTVDKSCLNYENYANKCRVPLCIANEKVSELFARKGYDSAKVLFYTDSQRKEKMLFEINELLENKFQVVNSNCEHIDVMAKDVSKGQTLLRLCDILGIKSEKVICFGDELNDLSMLKVAGLSVSVGNANPKLKEYCRLVTLSNDQGGVGVALKEYGI